MAPVSAGAVSRPVLRYHGGKWRLAPWIISHFPPHRVYVEPFGGGGSVLMRKERAELVDVYNDLDDEIVNVFRVLRNPESNERLRDLLECTPYARLEFVESYAPAPDAVEQARRTVVRSFMGFGSDSASGARTGFRANGNRQHNHPARDWTNYPPTLAAFCARLQGVVIESRDAVATMQQHDGPRTLHYVDPPYPKETRSEDSFRTGKGYRREMSRADHIRLAAMLYSLAGTVVVSGYACELYDVELYPSWQRHTRRAMADGGRERVEVLWIKPAGVVLPPPRSLTQGSLEFTPRALEGGA